jgi:hypothetical protein
MKELSKICLFFVVFAIVSPAVAAENSTVGSSTQDKYFNSSTLSWEPSENVSSINNSSTSVVSPSSFIGVSIARSNSSIESNSTTETNNSTTETNTDNFGSTDSSYFDKVSGTIADGIHLAIVRLADEAIMMGFRANDEELKIRDNYGYVVQMIYLMATAEFYPEENPFIQEVQIRCNIIGIFLILFYIFLGASSVNLISFRTAESAKIASKLNSKFHLSISEYGATVMEMCLMQIFGYFFLWFTIQIEAVFTKLIMLNILDKIAPTGENTIMYIMMTLCYLLIGIALAYRIIIISLFHCGYLIVVGLYCFNISREAAKAAFYYYLKMLFMRTIIVGITTVGVGVTSSIDVGSLGLAAIGLLYIWPLMYAALILILILISLKLIFGIQDIFGKTAKLVRYYA